MMCLCGQGQKHINKVILFYIANAACTMDQCHIPLAATNQNPVSTLFKPRLHHVHPIPSVLYAVHCKFAVKKYTTLLYLPIPYMKVKHKGNRTIADFRYEKKYIISPSTLIFAPTKS